jgi:hypothetical protein
LAETNARFDTSIRAPTFWAAERRIDIKVGSSSVAAEFSDVETETIDINIAEYVEQINDDVIVGSKEVEISRESSSSTSTELSK